MANVSLRNITSVSSGKSGERVAAVSELSLEIQDREFVVLVGPPDSGVSSIIRLIAGLHDISKGEIFVGDRRVNDVAPKDRDVAMVHRDYSPYPRMNVQENLAFGLKKRRFSDAEVKKRVAVAAEALGLKDRLKDKAESLSDEQRQRLAIARATALQPKVILFDEPLVNLDARTRQQLRGEIKKLHQRLQATAIYATHDPMEAMAIGGRIAVFNNGAIQQEGPDRTIYDEPGNVFVAEFFGNVPMNLISGELKQDRDSLTFSETGDGTIELRLPAAKFPSGQSFVGKTILLGIRPEEIAIGDSSKAERYSGSFPAIIDSVEATGSGAKLYLQTGASRLVCQTNRGVDQGEGGHRLQFQLNPGKVCLFDPVSGRRIA